MSLDGPCGPRHRRRGIRVRLADPAPATRFNWWSSATSSPTCTGPLGLELAGRQRHRGHGRRPEWQFSAPCVTTFELAELADWLDELSADGRAPGQFDFTEPHVRFAYVPWPKRDTPAARSRGEGAPPETVAVSGRRGGSDAGLSALGGGRVGSRGTDPGCARGLSIQGRAPPEARPPFRRSAGQRPATVPSGRGGPSRIGRPNRRRTCGAAGSSSTSDSGT